MTHEDKESRLDGPTANDLINAACDLAASNAVEKERDRMEREFKSKYSKSKGKPLTVTLFCTACTRNFRLKGKNNKSDDNEKQLCPHIIFMNWELDHDSD